MVLASLVAALVTVMPGDAQAAFGIATKWEAGTTHSSAGHGLATDPAGNVYVGTTAPSIRKFTPTGDLIAEWGTEGVGAGQFEEPTDIAADGLGSIYVTDLGTDRIQRFDEDGTFQAKWGRAGSGPGEFDDPKGIAADASGNVYVADTGNERIQRLTTDGVPVAEWTAEAEALATDPAGYVYAVSRFSDVAQKFTPDGVLVAEWPTTNGTTDIATDSAGNIYMPDPTTYGSITPGGISVFTAEGVLLRSFGCSAITRDQILYADAGLEVAAGPNDDVYVAGWLESIGILRLADPGRPLPCKPLRVSAQSPRDLDALRIAIRCPGQPCELRISGTVNVRKRQARLRRIECDLNPDERRTFRLRLQRPRQHDRLTDALATVPDGAGIRHHQARIRVRSAPDSTNNYAIKTLGITIPNE